MFFKSCYVDVFTAIIFSFIICIKKPITHLFKRLIYEIQINLHRLTTHMSTLIMCIIDLLKTKTRPWRHIYHDIEIPRQKSHDIEIPGPKSRDIEKRRQLTHYIVILRHFFRGQKATSRFHRLKSHYIEFPLNSYPYAP